MTIKNGDLPASPSGVMQDGMNAGSYPLNIGLTKREMFAMAALQGLASESGRYNTPEDMSYDAIKLSDALLAEL